MKNEDGRRSSRGGSKHESRGRSRRRRDRSRSRRRRRRRSPSSSYSSESHPRGPRSQVLDGSFMQTAARRPGHLLQTAISKLSSYIDTLQGTRYRGKSSELPPIVGTYLQSVLLPSRQGQTTLRNLQEMRTLAKVIDLMLAGHQAEACDILMQRFMAVECADQEGSWSMAKHYEIVGDPKISSASEEQRRKVISMEKSEARYRKDQLALLPARR